MGAQRPGAEGAEAQDDLDRLIGELEGEAARRRAAPSFPLEADGRIRAELDRLSPGRTPRADELVAAVLDAGATPPPPPPAPARRVGLRTGPPPTPAPDERPREVATAVAVALQVLFDRTAMARPGPPSGAGAGGEGVVGTWWAELQARRRGGRAVCAGTAGEELAGRLGALGLETQHLPGGPGDLAAALRALPPAAHAVVIADLAVGTPGEAADLAGALEHAASSVEVLSPAPWWWGRGRAAVDAALSPGRPLPAEAWIEELTRAGFTTTARYDADGRSYEVVGTRPELAGA